MRIPALAAAAVTAVALSLAALAPALAEGEKAPLSPDQEKRVQELVKEYILANPEIILEAVQTLRKKQEEAQKKAAEEALKSKRADLQGATDLPVAGNPKGDVTIVEFMDYRCGYCKGVQPTLDQVMRQDGKIRYVLKEFPILGPASRTASMAAIAAHKQGKYLAFHAALMAYPNNLTDEVIFALARQVGLDIAKLKDDMKAPEVEALIEKTHKLAQDLGINGTPGFIIGDQIIPGAVGADELKKKIAEARKACNDRKEPIC
jgi:protein-disulfide isomerase